MEKTHAGFPLKVLLSSEGKFSAGNYSSVFEIERVTACPVLED